MCGFQRSGSTLLQLMIEACVRDVRLFNTECSAPEAAQYAWRNHPYMFTKTPWDIFFLDDLRSYYATRRADVRFIVTVRDPRNVLTSSIDTGAVNQPDGYWIDPPRWTAYYEHFHYAQQFDDVLTVEYEDTICQPNVVQRRLAEFIGWQYHASFDQFLTAVPDGFDLHNLNGLRPLDRTGLASWRQEKHRNRIRRVLREIPRLPECVIEMGYESDTSWANEYL
jgi:hypothetical protein